MNIYLSKNLYRELLFNHPEYWHIVAIIYQYKQKIDLILKSSGGKCRTMINFLMHGNRLVPILENSLPIVLLENSVDELKGNFTFIATNNAICYDELVLTSLNFN